MTRYGLTVLGADPAVNRSKHALVEVLHDSEAGT